MNIKIDYMGVSVVIDTNNETITITNPNCNSKKLINMVFKSILNKVNIDTNNYKIINNTNCY